MGNKESNIEPNYGYEEPAFDFFGKKYLMEKGRMLVNNKILFYIAIFQMVIILVLLIGYIRLTSQKEFAVNIPDYGIVKVARMKANDLYYKVWGDYVVARIGNFTPTTIKNDVNSASKIFDTDSWATQKPYIDRYVKVIESNSITQNFSFNDNDVELWISKDGSKAVITYKGVAEQNIGKIASQKVKCMYRFGFFVRNGQPFQESISTDCLSGKNVGVKK